MTPRDLRFAFIVSALFLLAVAALPARGQNDPKLSEIRRMLPAISSTPPLVPTSTLSWAIGDLDGDMDPDVWRSGEVRHHVFVNDGNGVFTLSAQALPTIPDNASEIRAVLGDVDGDQDLDVLTGTTNSAVTVSDRLYLNDGTGGFTDGTDQIPATPTFAGDVFLADVDGDNDLDAYVGTVNPSTPDILWSNDGTGSFSDASGDLPASGDTGRAVAIADLDGDNDPDIVASHRLWRNDGTGTFTDVTATNMPSFGAGQAEELRLGDLDGDQDLDVLLGWSGGTGKTLRAARNDGTASFVDVTAALPAVTTEVGALAFVDVDADLDGDVLVGVGIPDTGFDRLFLNNGFGLLSDASSQLPSRNDSTEAIETGDLDGDLDPDVLLGNWTDAVSSLTDASSPDRYYLNDGQGTFRDVSTPVPTFDEPVWDVLVGDLDGDFRVDGVAILGDAPGAAVMRNAGSGVLTHDASAFPSGPANATRGALVDVEGDADLDLFLGTGGLASDLDDLYRNDGTGAFTDVSGQLPAVATDVGVVATGDVDGDADADVFVGNAGAFAPSMDVLLLNDGAGGFTDGSSGLPVILDQSYAGVLADLDGDNDLDAVVGGDPTDTYYRNAGNGTFADASGSLPQGNGITWAMAAGDADGDLDLDLFVFDDSQVAPTQNHLWQNDGAGNFTDVSVNLPAQFSLAFVPTDVALGDVDGDGSLDALVARESTNDALFLNDGTGVFSNNSATGLTQIHDFTTSATLADLDGDFDLDALLGNRYSHRLELLSGTRRLLAWRGLPRVGKALDLDIQGPPGGVVVLLLSLFKVWIPQARGILQAGPGVVFPGLPLSGTGAASFPLFVPNNPAIVGIPLYLQGILGFPIQFTNLEILNLTAF